MDSVQVVQEPPGAPLDPLERARESVDAATDPAALSSGAASLCLAEQGLASTSGKDVWREIVSESRLELLDLSFNDLDDQFWALPSCLDANSERIWTHLSVVNLCNNRFSGGSIAAIAAFLRRCPKLSHFDLSLNPIYPSTTSAEPLEPLLEAFEDPTLVELSTLDLSCICMASASSTPQLLDRLLRASSVRNVKHLHLRSNSLTDSDAIAIANALPDTAIEMLVLTGNLIADRGAAALAFALDRIPALVTLDLASNRITDKGLALFHDAISMLTAPCSLRCLRLDNNIGISPSSVSRFHEHLHAKIIEMFLLSRDAEQALSLTGSAVKRTLQLGTCLLDRHVAVAIAVLRTAVKWQQLEELDLSGNVLGRAGSAAIGLYLALHPALRHLNLANTAIDDTAISIVADGLETNATLQDLNLNNNRISDAGAMQLYLKGMALNPQRRVLLNQGNHISHECRMALPSVSQAHDLRRRFASDFASLELLNFSGKMLRVHGVTVLVEQLTSLSTPVCKSLDLSHNALGDDGAMVVAQLLRSYTLLERIDLSFNDIGDAGAAAIAGALSANASLLSLTWRSVPDGSQNAPRLTDVGITRLTQALHQHRSIASVDMRNNLPSTGATRAFVAMLRSNGSIQRFNNASAAVFLARHSSVVE